jgi:hypothetical protein
VTSYPGAAVILADVAIKQDRNTDNHDSGVVLEHKL